MIIDRISFFLYLFLLFPLIHLAQIKGKVTNTKGEALPYVNVYVDGTTKGTTTNASGEYQLNLEPGNYRLVFQYVGYGKEYRPVEIRKNPVKLDIKLTPVHIRLKEVIVKSGDEDPAYNIIRKAVGMRDYYLNQIKSYSAKVYVKGIQRIHDAPEKFLGMPIVIEGLDSTNSGIIYLSESLSKLHYKHPDQFKEEIISSKVSGDDRGFSWNRASEMQINFYKNFIKDDMVSERGFISPIADNALFHYNYKLEGFFYDNGVAVNKIRVIPKRKHDPVFSGHIYITDSTWRIHSLDLMLTKDNQIRFVDTLHINQTYFPVNDSVWMTLSQRYDFNIKYLALKGNGTFIAVYSDYKVEPSYKKRFFKNEVVKIEPEANRRDTMYWNKLRPVPLTTEEKKDYTFKDSLQIIKELPAYKDSIDSISNRPSLVQIAVFGYRRKNSKKGQHLLFAPLISILQYNTVEGGVVNFRMRYIKEQESRYKWYGITPFIRYGFSDKRLNGGLEFKWERDPYHFEEIEAEAGRFVFQFNENKPVRPLVNSIYTLFLHNNPMKIYEKTYAKLHYERELWNGFLAGADLEYAHRSPLENTTLFSFRNVEERYFQPNNPVNNGTLQLFNPHRAFLFNIDLRIRLSQQYESHPDLKYSHGTPYPEIHLNYKSGRPLAGSELSFDFVRMRIVDYTGMKLLGQLRWSISGGLFLNDKNTEFMDLHHFRGNQTIFANGYLKKGKKSGSFNLLPYYEYSTTSPFAEIHAEHHFNGFIFNKFPLLRKTKFRAVAGMNGLFIAENKYFAEAFAGVENILQFIRIDWATGIDADEKVYNGIRVGLDIPFD